MTSRPSAVEGDWNQLVTAYETASTVVPGDTESEQAALAVIYSSEKSAAAIDRWLVANCAVDIGPVFTIVPQDPVAATTLAPVPDTTVAVTDTPQPSRRTPFSIEGRRLGDADQKISPRRRMTLSTRP